jgi:hypothetical protein
MTSTDPTTRPYLLGCRNCGRSWQASYQVRTFTDDAGDHQLFYRDGAPAAAPWSSTCPFCGGLRVTVLPAR